MVEDIFKIGLFASPGILLLFMIPTLASLKRSPKIIFLIAGVVFSAAGYCFLSYKADYTGDFSRINLFINLLFYISFLIVFIFSLVRGIENVLIPFYGFIGLAGLTLINNDNVFISVVAMEMVFISTIFIALKNGLEIKDIYSYFIFSAFATGLIIAGLAFIYIERDTLSFRAIVGAGHHPGLYIVFVGILLKTGLFPFHRKFFTIVEENGYCFLSLIFIFWIPALLYFLIKYFVITGILDPLIFSVLVLAFIIALNLMAFRFRKIKKSVPHVLMASFAAVMLLHGQDTAYIFAKSYINYMLISSVLIFILSRDSDSDSISISRFDCALYIILITGGIGINFVWNFWVNLEINKFLFQYCTPLVLIFFLINKLLGLYNISVNSISIIEIVRERTPVLQPARLIMLLVCLIIVAGGVFPDRYDYFLNLFLRL